MKVIPEARRAH